MADEKNLVEIFRGAADGVAPLDSAQKVPLANIPDSLIGSINYQGTWDASTNTPSLSDPGTKGHYYVVSVAGSQDLGSGLISFDIGDWVISNGTQWEKADHTDAVVSVHGRTGVVTGQAGDYSHSQVTGQTADDHHSEDHASRHQDGGPDEVNVGGLSGELADPQPPKAHKNSHQDGGGDEISVAGLSGELADPQPPKAHPFGGSDHTPVNKSVVDGEIADASLFSTLPNEINGLTEQTTPDLAADYLLLEDGGATFAKKKILLATLFPSASFGEMYQNAVHGGSPIAAGIPSKVTIPTAAGQLAQFSHTSPGRLTYNGTDSKVMAFVASLSFQTSNNNRLVTLYIAINGAVVTKSAVQRWITTSTDTGAVALVALIALDPGDFIEVFADVDVNTGVVMKTADIFIKETAGFLSGVPLAKSHGEMYQSAPDTGFTTTPGIPIKATPPTTAGLLTDFVHTTPNKLQYTAAATRVFQLSVEGSFINILTGTIFSFWAYVNGVQVPKTLFSVTALGGTGPNTPFSVTGLLELATDDIVELYLDSNVPDKIQLETMNFNLKE